MASVPVFALRTFRADGTATSAPVWLGAGGPDTRFLLTPERSLKVRRLRRDPRVSAAESDMDGNALGGWRPGRATVVTGAERAAGLRALRAAYGARFWWFRAVLAVSRARRAGGRPVVVRIDLEPSP